jgi:hypothetical protein
MQYMQFRTRSGLFSQTAIDNELIDTSATGQHELYPLINGLSDHGVQLLILNKDKTSKGISYLHQKKKHRAYHSRFPIEINS